MADPGVHVPVLREELLALLAPQPGQCVIDATIDGGGHARALLERINPGGALLGIDRDAELIAAARAGVAAAAGGSRVVLVHGNFRDLGGIARDNGFDRADAVLFDLGLSSYHFDRSGRGFSFQRDEALDMRFDPADAGVETAAEILETRTAEQLTELFRDYGGERFASRIARTVAAARRRQPVATTTQLLDAVAQALPGAARRHAGRSAARVFQALRIAVNGELAAVAEALPQALEVLRPGGRLAVIAFHSLEDRLVKQFFVEARRADRVAVLTKRPVRPGDAEVRANSRAASARLRVAEKTGT